MHQLLKTDGITRAEVYRVSIQDIINLRHRLLRPGRPLALAHFQGDKEPSTWHVGLFHPCPPKEDAPLISCASFVLNVYKTDSAWQLRGMCTEPGHQSRGFGGLLLHAAEESIVKHSGVRLFWCNARVGAVRFYERHGWNIDSDQFDVPTVGPHRKMVKSIHCHPIEI